MAKKNLINAAVKFEIYHNLEEALDVLEKLNFIKNDYCLVESDALCWIEDEPSEKEKKRFLKKMGYEV